jgi:hypothetical protein
VFSTMLSLAAHSNNASQVEMVTHEASDLRSRQSRTSSAPRRCIASSRTGPVAAMETSVFVAEDLLKRLQPNMRNQPFGGLLTPTATRWRLWQAKSMRGGTRMHTTCLWSTFEPLSLRTQHRLEGKADFLSLDESRANVAQCIRLCGDSIIFSFEMADQVAHARPL